MGIFKSDVQRVITRIGQTDKADYTKLLEYCWNEEEEEEDYDESERVTSVVECLYYKISKHVNSKDKDGKRKTRRYLGAVYKLVSDAQEDVKKDDDDSKFAAFDDVTISKDEEEEPLNGCEAFVDMMDIGFDCEERANWEKMLDTIGWLKIENEFINQNTVYKIVINMVNAGADTEGTTKTGLFSKINNILLLLIDGMDKKKYLKDLFKTIDARLQKHKQKNDAPYYRDIIDKLLDKCEKSDLKDIRGNFFSIVESQLGRADAIGDKSSSVLVYQDLFRKFTKANGLHDLDDSDAGKVDTATIGRIFDGLYKKDKVNKEVRDADTDLRHFILDNLSTVDLDDTSRWNIESTIFPMIMKHRLDNMAEKEGNHVELLKKIFDKTTNDNRYKLLDQFVGKGALQNCLFTRKIDDEKTEKMVIEIMNELGTVENFRLPFCHIAVKELKEIQADLILQRRWDDDRWPRMVQRKRFLVGMAQCLKGEKPNLVFHDSNGNPDDAGNVIARDIFIMLIEFSSHIPHASEKNPKHREYYMGLKEILSKIASFSPSHRTIITDSIIDNYQNSRGSAGQLLGESVTFRLLTALSRETHGMSAESWNDRDFMNLMSDPKLFDQITRVLIDCLLACKDGKALKDWENKPVDEKFVNKVLDQCESVLKKENLEKFHYERLRDLFGAISHRYGEPGNESIRKIANNMLRTVDTIECESRHYAVYIVFAPREKMLNILFFGWCHQIMRNVHDFIPKELSDEAKQEDFKFVKKSELIEAFDIEKALKDCTRVDDGRGTATRREPIRPHFNPPSAMPSAIPGVINPIIDNSDRRTSRPRERRRQSNRAPQTPEDPPLPSIRPNPTVGRRRSAMPGSSN